MYSQPMLLALFFQQNSFQLFIRPLPSVSQVIGFLAVTFIIELLGLTMMAYLHARKFYYAPLKPLAGFFLFPVILLAVLIHLFIVLALLSSNSPHSPFRWLSEKEWLSYSINIALLIWWNISSYAWYKFIKGRMAKRAKPSAKQATDIAG